jgi:DNA polymerase-3 subunit alpha
MKQISMMNVQEEYVIDRADDIDPSAKSIMEFEVCGVFLRTHPIDKHRILLEQKNVKNSYQIKNEMDNGSHKIDIAGIIQKKDSRMSARGRFITIQLSDTFGNFEITIFNESILKEYVELLDVQKIVVVTCDMFKDEGSVRLTAIKFCDIEEYLKQNIQNMTFILHDTKKLENLTNLLSIKTTNLVMLILELPCY